MSQITVLDKANVPLGPFTRAQVAEKLQSGEFSPDSLAHVEGLSQWTPLREVVAKVDADSALSSGATLLSNPPAVAPGYSYAATMAPPDHLVYAGFWLRVCAIFIDGLIFLPLTLISYYLQYLAKTDDFQSPAAKIGLGLGMMGYAVFVIIARWLYFSLLESGAWQATVGKKAMGIRVTGMEGNRIGFGRATGRYFGKFISALTLCIGFIMAGFTERKQALHDMIAGTLVVRD